MSEANNPAEAPETSSTEVAMSDGRTVTFKGKRKLLKSTVIEGTRVGVRLDFINGETRLFWVPEALLLQFAGHGAEQKYGDATAGEKDVDDAVLAVDDLDTQIQRGEFNAKRESGGMSGVSVLLRAIVEMTGQPAEFVKAQLATMSHGDKMVLRNSSQLKPIIDRLEAEKAAKAGGGKADTAALLARFQPA